MKLLFFLFYFVPFVLNFEKYTLFSFLITPFWLLLVCSYFLKPSLFTCSMFVSFQFPSVCLSTNLLLPLLLFFLYICPAPLFLTYFLVLTLSTLVFQYCRLFRYILVRMPLVGLQKATQTRSGSKSNLLAHNFWKVWLQKRIDTAISPYFLLTLKSAFYGVGFMLD